MNAGFILEVCALKYDSLLIQVCFYVPPPPAFMFDHVLSKCYSIQFHCTYKSIDSPGHNLPNAEWCRIHQKSEEEEEEEEEVVL